MQVYRLHLRLPAVMRRRATSGSYTNASRSVSSVSFECRSTRRTPVYVDTEIGRTEGPIFRDETEAGNDLGGRGFERTPLEL